MGLEVQSRRGRPKGSGIDDSATLARIAALLAEDPSLKPTTAIRTLGIDDPSAIRRLRDKLKIEYPDVACHLAGSAPSRAGVPHRTLAMAAASDAAIREKPVLRVVPPVSESGQSSSSPSHSPISSGLGVAAALAVPFLALWLDVGLRTASMVVEAQQVIIQQWSRTPLGAHAIRQHIALNELAVAHLTSAFPRARDRS